MKEQIRKFYEDHKDEIVVGLAFGIYASAMTAFTFYKLYDGNKVWSADSYPEADNPTLFVHLKNGRFVPLKIEKV